MRIDPNQILLFSCRNSCQFYRIAAMKRSRIWIGKCMMESFFSKKYRLFNSGKFSECLYFRTSLDMCFCSQHGFRKVQIINSNLSIEHVKCGFFFFFFFFFWKEQYLLGTILIRNSTKIRYKNCIYFLLFLC